MNILYILGNGFDLAQGLNTSYSDFYDYLQKVSPKSQLEQRVMSDIKADYRSWADMEEALGKYSSKWKTPSDFLSVVSFLKTHLKDYLHTQNNRIQEMNLSTERLVNDICFPERHLFPKGRFIFDSSSISSQSRRIRCVTFNYTNTFEYVLAPAIKTNNVLKDYESTSISFKEIMHIHGSLDEMTLMGVNDVDQIANISFRDDSTLIEEFVKPEINEGCLNARNDYFEKWIREANVIVLFGVSLGETDNRWWQSIGNVLNRDSGLLSYVFYFPYDPDKNVTGHLNASRRWSDEFISFLQSRMELTISEKAMRNHILIGINSDIFNLKRE